jgi:hypothetical protein
MVQDIRPAPWDHLYLAMMDIAPTLVTLGRYVGDREVPPGAGTCVQPRRTNDCLGLTCRIIPRNMEGRRCNLLGEPPTAIWSGSQALPPSLEEPY